MVRNGSVSLWTLVPALLLAVSSSTVSGGTDPSFDHQTVPYTAQFKPLSLRGSAVTVTPFFSPDTSVDVEVDLINSAQSTLDLGIPSVSSWSRCDCSQYSQGCNVSYVRSSEEFPIFAAILNAIHRGVTVRILTNSYGESCGAGLIDPLSFWAVAGAQVQYYTTTTFLHTKYMSVDGKKAAVSSVNFSFTSFMENREAGMVIEGPGAAPVLEFLTSTFSFDFQHGKPWPTQQYNASQLAIINDKTILPMPAPVPYTFKQAPYRTSLSPVTASMDVQVIDSPDFAWDTIFDALNKTTSRFWLYIYQVTSDDFCDKIQELSGRVNDFKLLVSAKIYDKPDYELAKACYEQLYNANVEIYRTSYDIYTYSHNKFWIVDDSVFMSTGNWGGTDYPMGSNVFPPYGSSSWRNTNRDYTLKVTNADVVAQFQKVLSEDYALGSKWYP